MQRENLREDRGQLGESRAVRRVTKAAEVTNYYLDQLVEVDAMSLEWPREREVPARLVCTLGMPGLLGMVRIMETVCNCARLLAESSMGESRRRYQITITIMRRAKK